MNQTLITNLIKTINSNISDDTIQALIHELSQDKDSQIPYTLQYFFVQNKSAISTDWKWDVEDIFWGIKNCVPAFEYKILKNEFDDDSERYNIEAEINGEKIIFSGAFDELESLLEKINPFISKLVDAEFEMYGTGGDSYFYLLVPNSYRLSSDETKLVESCEY